MIHLRKRNDTKNAIPLLILTQCQKRGDYHQKHQKEWIEMVQIPNPNPLHHTKIATTPMRTTNNGRKEIPHQRLNGEGDSNQSLRRLGEGLHHLHHHRSHQKERVNMVQILEETCHLNDQAKKKADQEAEMIPQSIVKETRLEMIQAII